MKRTRTSDDYENYSYKVSMNVENDKYIRRLIYTDELQDCESTKIVMSEDPRHKKYLDLLVECGNYRKGTLLEMMKDQNFLDVIDRIGIEKLKLLLDSCGFNIEHLNFDYNSKDTFENILRKPAVLDSISLINIDKLHVIIDGNVIDDPWKISLLDTPSAVDSIIYLGIDQVKVLFQNEWFREDEIPFFLCHRGIIQLNLISAEKLQVLIKYYTSDWLFGVLGLTAKASVLKFIVNVDLEKISALLEFFASSLTEFKLFMMHSCVNAINDINMEKFIFFTGSDFFKANRHLFRELVNDRHRFNLVNSFSIDDLRIIFSNTSNIDISQILIYCTKFDVKKNLSFATALYKKGVISNFTFQYLSNYGNVLYNDVIQAFPNGFPIKRVLEKPRVKEFVPKLVDRCIALYVEHS